MVQSNGLQGKLLAEGPPIWTKNLIFGDPFQDGQQRVTSNGLQAGASPGVAP